MDGCPAAPTPCGPTGPATFASDTKRTKKYSVGGFTAAPSDVAPGLSAGDSSMVQLLPSNRPRNQRFGFVPLVDPVQGFVNRNPGEFAMNAS